MTEEQQQMIDDCMNRQTELTEWEQQFIDSMNNLETLSNKQDAVLTNLWERVTA